MNSKSTFSQRSLTGILALVLFAISAATGCQQRLPSAARPEAQTPTREVTDEAGKLVRVPTRIERVISLAPNLTEIIYAVGAGDRLVGNTTYCNYPAEAKAVAKIGDTMQPSIERIVALRPQLIFVSTASQLEAFTRQMAEQNIAIYVTDPHDLQGILRTIKGIGDLLDHSADADKVIAALSNRIAAVENAVKTRTPVSVFYQVSKEPLYTAGHDSYMTDVIRRAGGTSVTADVPTAWPRFSDEAALAARPEVIILSTDDTMNKNDKEVAASLKNSPAAKKGRVYGINGDFLSRPGPRLVDGLEEIARKLHPDAFGAKAP